MNTKQTGNVSEIQIIADLISRGISVSIPFGDNDKYDIIIEVDETLIPVQCKTANRIDGGVRFNTDSQVTHRSEGPKREGYENTIVEYFAVYSPSLDEIYWVPVEKASKSKMVIRTDSLGYDRTEGINFSESFKFSEQIE